MDNNVNNFQSYKEQWFDFVNYTPPPGQLQLHNPPMGDFLNKINTLVALGKVAFDACLNFYKQEFVIKNKEYVQIDQHELSYEDQYQILGVNTPEQLKQISMKYANYF